MEPTALPRSVSDQPLTFVPDHNFRLQASHIALWPMMSIATTTSPKEPLLFRIYGMLQRSHHTSSVRTCPRCMLRNPAWYPNAEAFQPERFQDMSKSDAENKDPRKLMFGFGRR